MLNRLHRIIEKANLDQEAKSWVGFPANVKLAWVRVNLVDPLGWTALLYFSPFTRYISDSSRVYPYTYAVPFGLKRILVMSQRPVSSEGLISLNNCLCPLSIFNR